MANQKPLIEQIQKAQVCNVIKYVAQPRPRATYQAYNTFIFQQLVVADRGFSRKNSPNPHVALTSLRYRWPDVFNEIVSNHYFFYYLHALATNRHNDICDGADLDELRSIGPPSCAQGSKLFEYKKHPDIVTVLEGFGPVDSALNLFELLTVENNHREYKSFNKIQERDALTSGDPARIKLASELGSSRIKEYRNLMLNLLIGLNDRVEKANDEKSKALIIDQAEAIIFALGRMSISEDPVYEVGIFESLLSNNPPLPEILQARIIYALGRYAQDNQTARKVLTENLGDDRLPLNIRTLIARNIGYIKWYKEYAQKVWEIYSPEWPLPIRHNLEIYWDGAVVGIKPEYITDEILRVMERNPWDSSVGFRLLELCLTAEGDVPERAFKLLLDFGKSPEDNSQRIQWLAELLPYSKRFRKECWDRLSELQKDVPWQAEVWERLADWAITNDDNDIVDALRKTAKKKACELLQLLLDERQVTHWRKKIEGALLELNDFCNEA